MPANPAVNNGVTSSPAGISCRPGCSEPYLPGTVVTLYAVPQTPGYVFLGWSGACTNTLTMDANKTVTANYRAQ